MAANENTTRFSLTQKLFIFKNSDLIKAPKNIHFMVLVAIIALLNIIGVVMVLSASSIQAINRHGTPWYYVQKQLVWLVLGTLAFIVTSRIPYTLWQKYTKQIVFGSVFLLLIVLIPGIGTVAYGARRWLVVGPINIQPSEIAKFAVILFCADFLNRRVKKMGSFKEVMTPILLTTGLIMALVVFEPDYDSTVIIGMCVAAILVMSGMPMNYLAKLILPVGVLATLIFVIEPYRITRLFSFLNPSADLENTSYQLNQSLISLGSGNVTGVGLGEGKAKWLYLPNAHTDFIFSIIGEELGILGTFMILALFAGFVAIGIKIVLSCPDRFSALLATGIVAWIGGQSAINILAAIGLLPVAGITLPFVSFGGSSLLISMAAAGVLGNIARHSHAPGTSKA